MTTARTRATVITDLQDIVQTDRHRWKETAFPRAITAALTAFNKDRPLTDTDEFELRTGKGHYLAPDCLIRYLGSYWGTIPDLKPYDSRYPGATPRINAVRQTSGMALAFSPAPTYKHLGAYGKHFEYWYSVGHVLSEDDCSITDDDYDLFITRALASLMRDLMAANVTDPVQLHRGMGSQAVQIARENTPLATYTALMKAYQEGIGGY